MRRDEPGPCLDEETLAALVDGALGDAGRARAEVHLAACKTCCSLVGAVAFAAGSAARGSAGDSDALANAEAALARSSGVGSSARLLPGDVVANKYRVERLLGRGGMGEVFEALHGELGHRVAIKVLLDVRPSASARLLREARQCAGFVSEHIARAFDVGRLPGGTPFIVMERLVGVDLAQLVAKGPLALTDVADYVRQACSALSEAHGAGIVHRDLKPANLFLTARQDGSPLLKVLDFGVSKSTLRHDQGRPTSEHVVDEALTSTGVIVGSPAYMSPEQIRAEKDVDARTDIWSLGVIMYELATGSRPFRASTVSALAVSIATERPLPPSSLRPGLPAEFDAVVARCLEKDRPLRFESVDALARALEAFASRTVAAAFEARVGRSPRRRHRWLPAIALGALVSSLSVAYWLWPQPFVPTLRAVSVGVARRSVAVIPLRNASDRSADTWLGTALADLLRTELASGDQLRILSSERVAGLERDLGLGETDSLERDRLMRIRDMVNADIALVGSYWKLTDADEVRLDVTLQDTQSGETLASVAEHGAYGDLFAVVSRVGERLRRKLGAEALSASALTEIRRTLPATDEARQWYAAGRASFDQTDYSSAVSAFTRVVETEPQFGLAHSMLSESWGRLNYDHKAALAAADALALTTGLPRKEQLLVEARAHLRMSQVAKAVEIYRSLFIVFPDDIDFGLELCRAQAHAAQAEDLRATIARLRELPQPLRDDPRIDLAEARAREAVSDHAGMARAAHQAFEKAQARGMRTLEVEARFSEAHGFYFAGRVSEAKRAFQDARDRYTELADLDGVGRALMMLGQLAGESEIAADDPEQGKRDLAEALRLFQKLGDRWSEGTAHIALGNVLLQEGSLHEAETEYRRALEPLAAAEARTGFVTARGNVAMMLTLRGEFGEAESLFSATLQELQTMGNSRLEAGTRTNRAALLVYLGRMDEARREYDVALQMFSAADYLRGVIAAQLGLAELLRLSGEPSAARTVLARAREGAVQTREPESLTEASLLAMSLDLEERQAARVLSQRDDWTKLFGSKRRLGSQARAHSRLALALLAESRAAEAREEAALALGLVRDSEDVQAVADATLADARVRAAAGDREGSRRAIEALLAHRAGRARTTDYEARLALAEIDKASHATGWQASVREIMANAGREHFASYAKRASALLE
jgi:serine/threonine protein kinase/tetratricopeptide (TPR) repeat protein